MRKAILLIIRAIHELAIRSLNFWEVKDIDKILDEAKQCLEVENEKG